MRLLIFAVALCTIPAAAQSVVTAPKITLDEHLPQHDSRTAKAFQSKQLLAARPLLPASGTLLEPFQIASVVLSPSSGRNSTCLAMRTYEFTSGRDSVDPKGYSTCIPANTGHIVGILNSK